MIKEYGYLLYKEGLGACLKKFAQATDNKFDDMGVGMVDKLVEDYLKPEAKEEA